MRFFFFFDYVNIDASKIKCDGSVIFILLCIRKEMYYRSQEAFYLAIYVRPRDDIKKHLPGRGCTGGATSSLPSLYFLMTTVY